jgi:hypothetical protein
MSYCVSLFSQPIYSRDFEARKKNVPLAIINDHQNYFYLLRYNKAAHDITIERRSKPSAEILAFTPLKLDSLNADWFDYEKLDHLFFVHNYHTYFLFERVLNSKKSIYLKISDTLGRSSGFIELASIEKETGIIDVAFEYKRTPSSNILLIASQIYGNSVIKKTVLLFDIDKRKMIWAKKLPVENVFTGYSAAFECNKYNDLFYVMIKAHVSSYSRKYINQTQVMTPVFFYDSLTLVSSLNTNKNSITAKLAINNLTALNAIQLVPIDQEVSVIAHFSKKENNEIVTPYFLNQKFRTDLTQEFYANILPMDTALIDRLTFYDGTDYKSAGEKEYKHLTKFQGENIDYQISERKEDYYYKELLVWKNDLETGTIFHQKIIPRKVFSFKGRTRFKNIGTAMPFVYDKKLAILVLESPLNFNSEPDNFEYHRFKKETNLWKANIVMYKIESDGSLKKKLVYRNTNFDAVPLSYEANDQRELVLYLNNGKTEKFVILKLDQL